MSPKKMADMPPSTSRMTRSTTRKLAEAEVAEATPTELDEPVHSSAPVLGTQDAASRQQSSHSATSRRSTRATKGAQATTASTAQGNTGKAAESTSASAAALTAKTKGKGRRSKSEQKAPVETTNKRLVSKTAKDNEASSSSSSSKQVEKGKDVSTRLPTPTNSKTPRVNRRKKASEVESNASETKPNIKRKKAVTAAPEAEGSSDAGTQCTKRRRTKSTGKEQTMLEENCELVEPRRRQSAKKNLTPEEVHYDMPAEKVHNMPEEMWMEVFKYLYPSEMTKFALCSKTILALVQGQPYWARLCHKAGLPEPKRKLPSYYRVALYFSDVVCEQCLSLSKPKVSYGSDRPLLVRITWNNDKKIHLCCACRVKYFERYPKYDAKDPNRFEADQYHITKGRAMTAYRLNEALINELSYHPHRNPHYRNGPPMRLYTLSDVQDLAFLHHGGFVGLLEDLKPFRRPRHKQKANTSSHTKRKGKDKVNNEEANQALTLLTPPASQASVAESSSAFSSLNSQTPVPSQASMGILYQTKNQPWTPMASQSVDNLDDDWPVDDYEEELSYYDFY